MHSATTAVPGDIGNLALVGTTIMVVGRISVVLRSLVGVVESSFQHNAVWKPKCQACRDIDTTNLHLANV